MDKLCRICNEIKEHSVRTNGRPATHCKECQRKYSKLNYSANKERYNARRYENQKKYRQRLSSYVQELKSKPCMDCGECYPYYVMDFDHLEDKEFNISAAISQGVSIIRLDKELTKCELVCSNCHRVRTYERNGV